MTDGSDLEQLDAPPPVSAEVRAKILADPNVAKLAAELEMSLDEYVNTVGYYLNNPGVEPAFLVVSDANLKKMGVDAPTPEALEANVRASVAAITAGQSPSGYEAPRKNTVELPSQGGEAVAAKPNPDLEDAVRKARMPTKS